MVRVNRLAESTLAEIGFCGIFFLFFFQLIADFVEGIYAFGLLGTSIPAELVSVILLFSPMLFLITAKGSQGRFLRSAGLLVLACRVIEVTLNTRGRMIVSGLGVGAFLYFFPAWLWELEQPRGRGAGSLILGAGLTLGLALSMLLRVSYSGFDISKVGWYQLIGWLLALIAIPLLLAFTAYRSSQQPRPDTKKLEAAGSFAKVTGLSLGLMAVMVLLYFTFTSPNVIARWTRADYQWIVVTLILVTSLFAWLLTSRPLRLLHMSPAVFWGINLLFVVALIWLIRGHQISFPADKSAYPLAEPEVSPLHLVPLFLMLILYPIILVDFILLSQSLIAARPTWRSIGGGFTLASLLLLLLILGQVFTTVYDYIPVVGPFFRDKFWFVFSVASLALLLSLLFADKQAADSYGPFIDQRFPRIMGLIGLAAIAAIFYLSARPDDVTGEKRTARILTYNVQQGYSEEGLKNFAGQLALIREVNADIIALQESDTNRIAGGNADLVRFLADRLDAYSYYGPKVVPGTFGIALLSQYPIDHPRTFYMYSEGEQTAAISAQIHISGQTFNLLVTHLGNGGPTIQQEAILHEVSGQEHLLMMGDFNFRPGSEPYQLTLQTWEDAWLLRWPDGVDDQGLNPADRIDHLFVSPGTQVKDIRYLVGPESDHPALMAEIEW